MGLVYQQIAMAKGLGSFPACSSWQEITLVQAAQIRAGMAKFPGRWEGCAVAFVETGVPVANAPDPAPERPARG